MSIDSVDEVANKIIGLTKNAATMPLFHRNKPTMLTKWQCWQDREAYAPSRAPSKHS